MKSITQIAVKSKRVFVRVDYNVPFDAQLQITDDNRILATLDLVRYLMDQGAKIILASHLGRPKSKSDTQFSLRPVAQRLSQLIDKEVLFVDDCIGGTVSKMVGQLSDGQILLLENLRFHQEEKQNNDAFSQQLAGLCDVYVNNAFAVSHRDQASITGIPKFVPEAVSGFLLEKEVQSYHQCVDAPKRPLVAIIGGAKVSSKLAALENMLTIVDKLIIGGAMANTFLKARGHDTKGSMIEEDLLKTAKNIMEKAVQKNVDLLLPQDLLCADRFDKDAMTKATGLDDMPDQWMALDIGPKTAQMFSKAVSEAGTIVWNGPMGVFEIQAFKAGTQQVADAVAASSAFSIVGGGDTVLAAKRCNIADQVGYISTGGGAFLHLMEGKELPGVTALK